MGRNWRLFIPCFVAANVLGIYEKPGMKKRRWFPAAFVFAIDD
jgi:hypothetical protein